MSKDNVFKETLDSTLETLGVTMEELQSKSRETRVVDARSLVAAKLKLCHGTLQVEIATLLGITQAAVSKMLYRHRVLRKYNAIYRKKCESINC